MDEILSAGVQLTEEMGFYGVEWQLFVFLKEHQVIVLSHQEVNKWCILRTDTGKGASSMKDRYVLGQLSQAAQW